MIGPFSVESFGNHLEDRPMLSTEGWRIVVGIVALRAGKGGYLLETFWVEGIGLGLGFKP